jgi:hypothetical protein
MNFIDITFLSLNNVGGPDTGIRDGSERRSRLVANLGGGAATVDDVRHTAEIRFSRDLVVSLTHVNVGNLMLNLRNI